MRRAPGVLVLGVDTVVVVDGESSASPASAGGGVPRAGSPAARTRSTAVSACADGAREESGHAVTGVTFRALDHGDVARYVASGEWRERAGGYAIQGIGSALVTARRRRLLERRRPAGRRLWWRRLQRFGIAPLCSWREGGGGGRDGPRRRPHPARGQLGVSPGSVYHVD